MTAQAPTDGHAPPARARSTRLRIVALASVLCTLLAAPDAARAQEGCEFGPGTSRFEQRRVGTGFNRYFSTPHFLCADGVEIWADSAVDYSELGMSVLMGSVRYLDRTRELQADTARYFGRQARLQAYGSLFMRDETDGSQIRYGELVYLRETDFRPEESMTVTVWSDGVRPIATIRPTSDSGPQDPYTVVANRIDLEGDDSFRATGFVEITRTGLTAFGDSADFASGADELVLDGSARVISQDTELVARTIAMAGPGGDSSRVDARHEAVLTGDGVVLTSPRVLVFLLDGDVERLVATPLEGPDSVDLARPVAVLDDAELVADSLDIVAPQERIERVIAVGRARSVSTARDSLNVEALTQVARSDWLEGDTVVVHFRTPEPEDSAAATGERPAQEIERVNARGRASALYRLTPSDSTARAGVDLPALHYVRGDTITITMADGDVSDLRVVGQTRGVHLEPLPRRAPPADTAGAALAPVPDTGRVAGDTIAEGGRTEAAGSERRTPQGPERSPAHPHPPGGATIDDGEMPWIRE